MQQNSLISLEQSIEYEPLVLSPEALLSEVVELMNFSWTNSCSISVASKIAATNLASIHHSCAIAIANFQIQGILTEQALVRLIASGINLSQTTLGEVMTRNVVTLSNESQDIFAALNLFHQYKIRHLPVVDRQRHLLGLVTQHSLRQALRSTDILKFRTVREVMTRAIHALPTASVLEVAQLMTDYQVSDIPIVEIEANDLLIPQGIITERDIVQFQLLELNLSQVQAREVMSTPLCIARPEDSLWEVQQQIERHLLQRLVVVGEQGELLGIVSQNNLLQAVEFSDLRGSLEIVEDRVRQLAEIKSLQNSNLNLTNRVAQQVGELAERQKQEQLVAQVALRIRQSLDLGSILQTTVEEVRQLIKADRVLIYRFEPDMSGIVSTEAVSNPRWSILDRVIKDSCFEQAWIEPYQQGHIFAAADIYRAGLSPCHIEFLESFEVKANVAIPILLTAENTSERLWGLLIVHQCSHPRNWQQSELDLLKLLTTQVAIAIQQGELYQQAQVELEQRKLAEAKLLESEVRFRSVANSAPVLIWMSGTDKLYTFFNQPWLDFTGQTLEQELGNGWTEGMHDDDRERFWQLYSASFERRQEFTMEYRLRRADGEYRWILDRGVPRFSENGEFTGYIGSCIDISDRISTEKTLQERETQLRTALDAADLGTWIWDIGTNEVILSEGSQSILDFAPGEFPGTLEAVLKRIHAEDRDKINKQAKAAIALGGLYEVEIRLCLANNKHRWLVARGHVSLDLAGQPTRMMGIVADITEKKRMQEQSLRHQRLESLGSLAGGVAHDLNNILTPIMMSVQLLPLTLTQIDPRSREIIQMLENNVQRGSALVQQVLSFARGVQGEFGVVQVKHLIRDIHQIARETFPKSIEIRIDISPQLWTVRGDATQIHQILLNLAINAKDAMPEGGLLDISAVNLVIDEAYLQENPQAKVGSYVAISVVDTGVGIAPEVLQQIFEPFFTTKAEDGGTGLGLATVINIVQNHGGFIDVTSQVNQGTQFNVFFPAVEATNTGPSDSVTIAQGKKELILIVDDEATIREITKASLEAHNYRVMLAKDGIEAVANYVKNREDIAVVLMNMMMPAMDGMTAIRTLQKINPQVKIIAVSGRNFTERTFSDRQVNIKNFIAKPYTTQALLQVVKEVVDS